MKNFLNNSYKFKGRFLGWGTGPDADWRIIFASFLILLILVVGVCIISYFRVRNAEILIGNDGQSAVNTDELRKVSSYYQKAKLDFESAKSVPATTPDPSI